MQQERVALAARFISRHSASLVSDCKIAENFQLYIQRLRQLPLVGIGS